MRIKCKCGNKVEVLEVIKDKPIMVLCECGRVNEIEYSTSLHRRFIALKVYDFIIVAYIIFDVLSRLVLKFVFKWDIPWFSFVYLLLFILRNKKIAWRIIVTISIVVNIILMIFFIELPFEAEW